MSAADPKLVERLTKSLVNEGKIIEAGWASLRITVIPPDAPPVQINSMREAFFAGAQHLFGSIMTMLDPDAEPTDADMRRMRLIDNELKQFLREYKRAHGLG